MAGPGELLLSHRTGEAVAKERARTGERASPRTDVGPEEREPGVERGHGRRPLDSVQ